MHPDATTDFRFPTLFARQRGIMGGEMCILGTRMPIRLLYQLHSRGMSVDEIRYEYPHLTQDQIVDSIERVKWAIQRDIQNEIDPGWAKLAKKAFKQWCKENPP